MLKVLQEYIDQKRPTPQFFKDKYIGSKCLIICGGPSAGNLKKVKEKLRDNFDIIIGVNGANAFFEDEMDFHIVLEKNCPAAYEHMFDNGYRKDLPRILNWKAFPRFPKDINYIKCVRNDFDGTVDIRSYEYRGTEGLFIGPMWEEMGMSVGSVSCNAIHFAGIIGASDVYLIGSELVFKGDMDHFYDRYYRDLNDEGELTQKIVECEIDGKKYLTTDYFYRSGVWLDDFIKDTVVPSGINVYDMSDGMLKNIIKVDIMDVIK